MQGEWGQQMGVNANVGRNIDKRVTRSRLRPRIKQKQLERRGKTRRLPADIAAAVVKQVMRTQAMSLADARKAAETALDEFHEAIRRRDAARVEAVRALWANPRLALDREFLEGALKLMHPAEIRPFVPDGEAESYRHLIGEVWSGAAETRNDGRG